VNEVVMSQQQPGVVITGASAGVGRATALAFGRRGWRVGLIARGQERLEAAREEVLAAGGTAFALPADVADAEAVERQADTFECDSGPIDVWVNDAMVTIFAPFAEMSPEEFRRVTEVTYLGQVYGAMAALKHMRPRNRGTIIGIGSALAYRSIPLQSAYCGSKSAVRGFMDSLRSELLHENSHIRLTTVHLPAVNTPQFDWARNRLPNKPRPVAPVFQPEAIGEEIFRAAAHAPRELWVGLPTAQAILGNMVVPAWLDRYLARSSYPGQQSQEPDAPNRANNLFAPVPGNYGTHGRFDRGARAAVIARSGTTVRVALGCAVGIAALSVLGLAARQKGRRH
jgi:NAD(P)-dependent dehydrogenase (short-subunit alcohol dehydrogenase family)